MALMWRGYVCASGRRSFNRIASGGGLPGCELAQASCRFGSRTSIAHSEPLFLPNEERHATQLVFDAR